MKFFPRWEESKNNVLYLHSKVQYEKRWIAFFRHRCFRQPHSTLLLMFTDCLCHNLRVFQSHSKIDATLCQTDRHTHNFIFTLSLFISFKACNGMIPNKGSMEWEINSCCVSAWVFVCLPDWCICRISIGFLGGMISSCAEKKICASFCLSHDKIRITINKYIAIGIDFYWIFYVSISVWATRKK